MTDTATAAALRKIELAFANPNGRAVRMARTMLRVTHVHPACRARYIDRAYWIQAGGWDLDRAIYHVEAAWMLERAKHHRSALLWGHSIRPLLVLDTLKEMRLLLRWLRRHQPCRLPEILDALTTPPYSVLRLVAE